MKLKFSVNFQYSFLSSILSLSLSFQFSVQVFVMTPQILLGKLCHCFISIELIALLIFDECHYAQLESDHPYAEIMKVIFFLHPLQFLLLRLLFFMYFLLVTLV